MKEAELTHLKVTQNYLTITLGVDAPGQVWRHVTYRLWLEDVSRDDALLLINALEMELNMRVRQQWDQLQDELPF